MTSDLSATMRSYLAEIYRLCDYSPDPKNYISTSALADLMDVSAPAVNRMVTRLKEMGLLEHEPYQGVRLTAKGQQAALQQLRYHRIAEVFLVEVMGFHWHEIYEEAQRMSTALGDVIAERMLEMAGNPDECPHGEPIPDTDGTLPETDDRLLTTVEAGMTLQITRVRTRETDRLEYLAALGLVPGTAFELLHVAPFNGPMQLKVGKEYRIIGHNLAEMIRVHVLDAGSQVR